jgi:hypothetical protein
MRALLAILLLAGCASALRTPPRWPGQAALERLCIELGVCL